MGNPRMNCVADDLHRRPLADRGSPGRTHGNAVTNPRIRVCSTVVLTALSPALRNRFIRLRPDLMIGTAHARSISLTTNIRVHARQLALEPRLQILRRYRRSLLRRLEQAHRSALEHHVHRIAPMGARVLINETWYNPPLCSGACLTSGSYRRDVFGVSWCGLGLLMRSDHDVVYVVDPSGLPCKFK